VLSAEALARDLLFVIKCYFKEQISLKRDCGQKTKFKVIAPELCCLIFADNPPLAELDGRLGSIHYLLRAVKLTPMLEKVASIAEHVASVNMSSHLFVAFRMRNVSEFAGAVAHTLVRNIAVGANQTDLVKRCFNSAMTKRFSHCLRLFFDGGICTYFQSSVVGECSRNDNCFGAS
jgi:hypothetical protein